MSPARDGRTYLIRAEELPSLPSLDTYPTVSFCIPTRNRRDKLQKTLALIRQQTYPGTVEIVVADNGSSDDSVVIAKRYADIVFEAAGELGAVRQETIEASTGAILGIVDDDLYIEDPGWLQGAVRLLCASEGTSTLWPRLIPPRDATAVTRCFFDLNQAIFDDRMRHQRGVFGGGNSLFKREAVTTVGGFEREVGFGEDMILAQRLRDAGYSVIYYAVPAIHDSMYSLGEIYKKQKWGSEAVRRSGFRIMQQSLWELLFEQYVIGVREMVRGMARGRFSWGLYPVIAAVKSAAYVGALRFAARVRRQA